MILTSLQVNDLSLWPIKSNGCLLSNNLAMIKMLIFKN